MRVEIVTKNADALRDAIARGGASPIAYNSPKPKEVLDEDKVIQAYKLNVKPSDVVITPVAKLFQ
jgi:zinc protease